MGDLISSGIIIISILSSFILTAHLPVNRISPVICIINAYGPYAFISTLCSLAEIHTQIQPVIIRKPVIVGRVIEHLETVVLIMETVTFDSHPVAGMVVPACISVETLREAMGSSKRKLMSVVIPVISAFRDSAGSLAALPSVCGIAINI